MISNPPTTEGGSAAVSSKKKRWKVHAVSGEAGRISKETGVHSVVASILHRRGHDSSIAALAFLNASLKDLQDPMTYSHMAKAVQRIRLAIDQGQKILVYGDYDVDGVTGASILYPALKKLGAQVEAYIPHRIDEGYGLNVTSLEKLMLNKFQLVITVDNGVTSIDAIKFLNSKGADVIIVDHHTPKDEFPPAFAIVSAALPGDQGDANLAACGLAFKVVWALSGDFEFACQFLDLVVMGTIADIAPVLGDNRKILKEGLAILAGSKRPGVVALMETARLAKNYLTYRDVAFSLGPRINASGRMGSPMNAFKLLTTDNPLEARNLAQILEEGNRDRQKAEAEAFEDAVRIVEADAAHKESAVLVLSSSEWHVGVLGIVAARLVEKYHKPSIVISVKNGIGKGSGRSIESFSIHECAKAGEDLMVSFGGHAQACGLTIQEENIALLRQRVNRAASDSRLLEGGAELLVDAAIDPRDLQVTFLKDLARMEPYGPGNNKPLFLTRGLKMRGEPKKMGKDTLRCWLSDVEGKATFEVIGFRAYTRWMETVKPGQAVDIVYQPSLKSFQGIVSIQLEMEDWMVGS